MKSSSKEEWKARLFVAALFAGMWLAYAWWAAVIVLAGMILINTVGVRWANRVSERRLEGFVEALVEQHQGRCQGGSAPDAPAAAPASDRPACRSGTASPQDPDGIAA